MMSPLMWIVFGVCLVTGWALLELLTSKIAQHIKGKFVLSAITLPLYACFIAAVWVLGGFWIAAIMAFLLGIDYRDCYTRQDNAAQQRELTGRKSKGN